MTLRLAEKKDLNDCLRMAKAFHSVSPYSEISFSEQKCRELFDTYLNSDKTNLIFILAEDSQRPYGMIIGIKSSAPFSDEEVCTELAWWVDEDKRGRESLDLLRAYEEWSRRVGSGLTVVAMLDEVTDLSKFYNRLGYKRAEQSFVRKTWQHSVQS